MIIETLKVANLRVIEQADFSFRPGLNLIVGINGAGKTTVLNALGICLSSVVRIANNLRRRVEGFSVDDIRIGADALTVECGIRIDGLEHYYIAQRPRESNVARRTAAGWSREQVLDTPRRSSVIVTTPSLSSQALSSGRPFGMLFSTSRAVTSNRAPRKGAAAGGVTAALAGAFADRELRLAEFAAWMKVRESMSDEQPLAGRALEACERAVARFLPEYENLRLDSQNDQRLLIDRGSTTIPVQRLSDGERGSLSLVLELTRRLAQANPELADPASEAESVILIDELELHLHPSWQRQIVHNLTTTFPRCQFIATTHSPQIIGEVLHDNIQVLSDGMVYPLYHSFGIDSSRILEEIMQASRRNSSVAELLSEISQEIGVENFDEAQFLLRQLTGHLGESDAEVIRIRTLLSLLGSE